MDLSSLSNYDFVCIVANYNSVAGDGKSKIDPKIKHLGYSPEALAQLNKKFTERFSPVTSCGLKFTKPFGHLEYEPMGYVYTLFENYERGCLPFPGSTSEQPAQIMEIFSVLSRLKGETETKAIESLNSGRNQHKNKPRARR